MNNPTALPVIAMRLRMAMLRHAKQSVDTTRLVNDPRYADEVLRACRALNLEEVTLLVQQFDVARGGVAPPAGTPSPAPAPAAPGPAPVAQSPRLAPAAAPASRPPPGAPPSSGLGGASSPASGTASGDSELPDPNDPNHPRTRRYLRGAR